MHVSRTSDYSVVVVGARRAKNAHNHSASMRGLRKQSNKFRLFCFSVLCVVYRYRKKRMDCLQLHGMSQVGFCTTSFSLNCAWIKVLSERKYSFILIASTYKKASTIYSVRKDGATRLMQELSSFVQLSVVPRWGFFSVHADINWCLYYTALWVNFWSMMDFLRNYLPEARDLHVQTCAHRITTHNNLRSKETVLLWLSFLEASTLSAK